MSFGRMLTSVPINRFVSGQPLRIRTTGSYQGTPSGIPRASWPSAPSGAGSVSPRQQRPRFPQLRKEFLLKRQLQKRRARASSRAHAKSNNSLNQLNMPQAPAHHQLVKLSQALANINPVAMVAL